MVWELRRGGPWVSYPPLEFGIDQSFSEKDWARADPPGFLLDNERGRKSWDQRHELYTLTQKMDRKPFTDKEFNRIVELASYPDDWFVRRTAISLLWESKRAEDPAQRKPIIDILSEHLHDAHYEPRTTAALGLARLNTWHTIPEVLRLVKGECSPGELWGLVIALDSFCAGAPEPALTGVPETKEAVPVLIRLLKSEDEETRQRVAYVLGQVGPDAKQACSALREALRESERDEEQQRMERHWIYRWGERGTLSEVIRHALHLIERENGEGKR